LSSPQVLETWRQVLEPRWHFLAGKKFSRKSRKKNPLNIPCIAILIQGSSMTRSSPTYAKAYLHMVARRSPVFPCIELLKWIIDHVDAQKCLINDDNDECIEVFLPSEVQSYYKLRDSELKLSTDFILSFYVSHNTSKIMVSWWREDKKFTNQTAGW
jgi:hypothetical protein